MIKLHKKRIVNNFNEACMINKQYRHSIFTLLIVYNDYRQELNILCKISYEKRIVSKNPKKKCDNILNNQIN